MQSQKGHVIIVGQTQEAGANQRASGEIKRPLGFFHRQSQRLSLAFRSRQAPQVGERDRQSQRGRDDLNWLIAFGRKRCPQNFVAVDDLIEASLQRRHVERARKPHGNRDVVERASRLQLIEEPQALLGEGKRQGTALSLHRRDRDAGEINALLFEQQLEKRPFLGREIGDLLEEVSHCQFPPGSAVSAL